MSSPQVEALMRDKPFLHLDRHGAPKDGGTNRPMAQRFVTELGRLDAPRIAETGTGVSTLIFLTLAPASVISISPDAALHERTRREAEARGIDHAPLRLIDDRSEAALPLLALVEQLEIDAGFIDGNHGWPAVFVDFCYLNRMLRLGGLLFVDDIQLYGVAQLVGLLRQQQPHYELVAIDGNKMATFRKGLDTPYLPDGSMEPFLATNGGTSSHHRNAGRC
jgi:predicted O-methyltransferase YrrM